MTALPALAAAGGITDAKAEGHVNLGEEVGAMLPRGQAARHGAG